MASSAQIAANRRNAQLSTGPRTEEGKQRSKMNALTHGLTAKEVALGPEESEAYPEYARRMTAAYAPANDKELEVVTRIIACAWRLKRIPGIETQILRKLNSVPNTTIGERLLGDEPNMKALQGLSTHETKIDRAFYRALKELKDLQGTATRAKNRPAQPAEHFVQREEITGHFSEEKREIEKSNPFASLPPDMDIYETPDYQSSEVQNPNLESPEDPMENLRFLYGELMEAVGHTNPYSQESEVTESKSEKPNPFENAMGGPEPEPLRSPGNLPWGQDSLEAKRISRRACEGNEIGPPHPIGGEVANAPEGGESESERRRRPEDLARGQARSPQQSEGDERHPRNSERHFPHREAVPLRNPEAPHHLEIQKTNPQEFAPHQTAPTTGITAICQSSEAAEDTGQRTQDTTQDTGQRTLKISPEAKAEIERLRIYQRDLHRAMKLPKSGERSKQILVCQRNIDRIKFKAGRLIPPEYYQYVPEQDALPSAD